MHELNLAKRLAFCMENSNQSYLFIVRQKLTSFLDGKSNDSLVLCVCLLLLGLIKMAISSLLYSV